YRNRHGVSLLAYCLMPNHVHLLLEPLEGSLDRFMQGVQQSYTQYFNRAYGEVGHLFQGRYKASPCREDRHLLAVLRYIHQNPVRAHLVARVDQYRFSSHPAYLAGRGSSGVDPRPLLRILGGQDAYHALMREMPETRDTDVRSSDGGGAPRSEPLPAANSPTSAAVPADAIAPPRPAPEA